MSLALGVLTVGTVPAAAALVAPAVTASTAAADAPRVYRPFAVGAADPIAAQVSSAAPVAESSAAASPVAFVTTTAPPGSAAAKAIEFALAQRGLPYVWGGNGPQHGDAGFDCSGLTSAAYAYAGLTLPRTAHTQYYAGPHVPDDAELQPGDLVFYGVPARVHHVGLYVGGGRMVNAPTFGRPVQLAYVRYTGDDYLGATRPAAGQDATGLIPTSKLPVTVPPTPTPGAPQGPSDFLAPTAPDPAPDRVSGPATPQQLRVAAEGPAQQQSDVGTTPRTEDSPDPTPQPGPTPPLPTPALTPPPATTPPVTTPPVTTQPVTTQPVTKPPVTTPPTTTPVTTTPSAPTPPEPPAATTPPAGTPAAGTPPAGTPAAGAPPTPKPPAPTTPTAPPAAKAPSGLVLPSGTLTLVRAANDANGLPGAPASATRGSLGWHPGTGDAWTAAVTLDSGVATGALKPGARVVVTGPGGVRTTLTVSSVSSTDAATAETASRTVGSGPRVVLLQTDPATGKVLVVTAT